MPKRKRQPPETDETPQPRKPAFNLLAKENRGLLLDLVVFVANVLLMGLISRFVFNLFSEANQGNSFAMLLLLLACVGMYVLPAAGAVLKRWHFHKRLSRDHQRLGFEDNKLGGCLFNPIFYFCLNLVVMSAIVAAVGQSVVGKKGMDNGAIFVPAIFIGLALTIYQTYLIYRYFVPPKKPPTSGILLSPESEIVGDVCIFVNMLLYQSLWNLLAYADIGRVSGVVEFLGRLFFLVFLALMIYFPPRMFYLAEDINKGRTWLTMLLANSPVIFKVLIGTKSPAGW